MAPLSSWLRCGSKRAAEVRFVQRVKNCWPAHRRWVLSSCPSFHKPNLKREAPRLPGKLDAVVQGQQNTHHSFGTHPSLQVNPLRSSLGLNWSIFSALAVAVLLVVASLGAPDQTATEAEDLKSVYPPLSDSTDGLRLLVLLPGYWFQPIRCQLISTTFSANPQYEALSYAWGADPAWAFRSISLNGIEVKVGRNLWSALSHLRNRTQPRVLWIDALCINQDDTDDKNKQIPLMLFIYSRARGVLVWLGTRSPPPLDMARLSPTEYVAQVERMRVLVKQQEMNRVFDKKLEDMWDQLDDIRKQLDKQNGHSPSKERHYRSEAVTISGPPSWNQAVGPFLSALIHQDYWTRTWIVQEFIVASKITVFFGHSYMPWDTSVISWHHFLRWVTYYNQVVSGDESVQFILKLNRMRDSQFRDASNFTLASLIDTFQGSLCQLPHDRIYAFLGLAHDHIGGSIPIDYRKPLFEVYQDAIHYQNTASVRNGVERAAEMVHFSAVVYRQLTQDSLATWQQDLASLDIAQRSKVEGYNLWGKPRELDSFVGSFGTALLRDMGIDSQTSTSTLKPDDRIALRGVAIRIKHIGPPLSELHASYTATKRWAASIANHIQNPNQLEKARGLNNKLLMTLTDCPEDMRPFVGTGGAIGLAPANARKGDLVCQFWNHGTCAVLRENADQHPESGEGNPGYDLVGKSVLVSSVEQVDWEVVEDKTQFTRSGMGDGSWVLDLQVDLPGLMHLSLDTFV